MAAESKGLMERVPIDITKPEGGYVEFQKKDEEPLEAIAGVYSFTYYFRKAALGAKWAPEMAANINVQNHPWVIYITGLDLYTQLVKSGAPAPGWKVIVYTDQQTLDDIAEWMPSPFKEKIQGILADSAVIVAKVVWPEYAPFPAPVTTPEKKVENAILRAFRLFSFVRFNCPVFVRDADTTHSILHITNTEIPKILTNMRVWETTFLEQARAKGFPLIYASELDYGKEFHKDYRLNTDFGSTGAFAGMVNYLGGIAEMRDLWQEALSYIRGVCHIVPETGLSSNKNHVARYIGKDEQILLFVLLPPLMDRTFFFVYNFVGGTGHPFIYWGEEGDSPFSKAFLRIRETFPEQFERKKAAWSITRGSYDYWSLKNSKFFAYPDHKLSDFIRKVDPQNYLLEEAFKRGLPQEFTPQTVSPFNATPPPPKFNLSGIEPKSREELVSEVMEEWVGKGWTDPGDPIGDPRWLEYDQSDSLHNPYSVIEAFRNPRYDAVLRIVFEELQRAHRSVCSSKGIAGRYALAAKFNVANEANRVAREKKEAAAAAQRATWEAQRAKLEAERAANPAPVPPLPAWAASSLGAGPPAWPAGSAPRPLGLGLGLGGLGGLGLGLGAQGLPPRPLGDVPKLGLLVNNSTTKGGRRKKTRKSKKSKKNTRRLR
jgi:hypothetical protein